MLHESGSGPRVYLPPLWFQRLVLVDGMARSGKSLVATMISALDRMEPWQLPIYVDHVSKYLALGQLTVPGAVASLRIGLNSHAFDYAIGRGLNTRPSDWSCIARSRKGELVHKRSGIESYDELLADFHGAGRVPVFVTHEQAGYWELWKQAVCDLKVVEVCRHPATMLASWERKGLGNRWGRDPIMFVPCADISGFPVPLFAAERSTEWHSAAPEERALLALEYQYEILWKSMDEVAGEGDWLKLVTLEGLQTQPQRTLSGLAEWLGTSDSDGLASLVMSDEQLPRERVADGIEKDISGLRTGLPALLFDRLMKIVHTYESRISALS